MNLAQCDQQRHHAQRVAPGANLRYGQLAHLSQCDTRIRGNHHDILAGLFRANIQRGPRLRTDTTIDAQPVIALKLDDGLFGIGAERPRNGAGVIAQLTQPLLKPFHIVPSTATLEQNVVGGGTCVKLPMGIGKSPEEEPGALC
jgi:hypothetical protein